MQRLCQNDAKLETKYPKFQVSINQFYSNVAGSTAANPKAAYVLFSSILDLIC